jgi:hypothetical protein
MNNLLELGLESALRAEALVVTEGVNWAAQTSMQM